MKNPVTVNEWQRAVDAADDALRIDDMHQFGFGHALPLINVSRCKLMLFHGAQRGIFPSRETAERLAIAMLEARASERVEGVAGEVAAGSIVKSEPRFVPDGGTP